MAKLPQRVLDAWAEKADAPVVTTVDAGGIPNSIYATCVSFYQDEKVLVANNFFSKTLKNVAHSCKGSFLFLTKDNKAYQLKGTYHHYTSGEYFDDMKKWNPEKLPGVGVAVLDVEEIYSGAEKISF